jgi:tripartite-type tricarboxylate transporter receptor subunit TctC
LHQVAGELFKMMTGVDMIHVPYRGDAPALTDLIGGQVQIMFGTVPGCIEINAALADPKMKARLADLGGTVLPGSPAEFGKLIAEETEKWGKVVKFADIKVE